MKNIKKMIISGKQKNSGNKPFNLNPLLPEPVDFQGFFNRKKIKVRNHLYQRLRTFVEKVVLMDTICGGAQGAVTAL